VHEVGSLFGNGTLDLAVRHDAPLWMPFSRFVFPWAPLDGEGIPRVSMEATATQGEHAGLYLE
jgi:hypothetical protein